MRHGFPSRTKFWFEFKTPIGHADDREVRVDVRAGAVHCVLRRQSMASHYFAKIHRLAVLANLGALGDFDNLWFASHRAAKNRKAALGGNLIRRREGVGEDYRARPA
jgi:hypothetical protein